MFVLRVQRHPRTTEQRASFSANIIFGYKGFTSYSLYRILVYPLFFSVSHKFYPPHVLLSSPCLSINRPFSDTPSLLLTNLSIQSLPVLTSQSCHFTPYGQCRMHAPGHHFKNHTGAPFPPPYSPLNMFDDLQSTSTWCLSHQSRIVSVLWY